MGLHKINTGQNVPNDLNVIIEIPANADPVKYELDKDSGTLQVDRFIATLMRYPCNYGYIPMTHSEDGDPLDALVVTPFPLQVASVIRVRPIGLLSMIDESGKDNKILTVPVDKLTPMYKNVQKPQDLPETLLGAIAHFFEHYKALEKGKWAKLDGWLDVDAAKSEILRSVEREKAK